jgi:hypothetical protein
LPEFSSQQFDRLTDIKPAFSWSNCEPSWIIGLKTLSCQHSSHH